MPTAFAVFCAAFTAAVMVSSGDSGAVVASSMPGHTVARMKERVVSIKGNSA